MVYNANHRARQLGEPGPPRPCVVFYILMLCAFMIYIRYSFLHGMCVRGRECAGHDDTSRAAIGSASTSAHGPILAAATASAAVVVVSHAGQYLTGHV
jgi:hypothetical protein